MSINTRDLGEKRKRHFWKDMVQVIKYVILIVPALLLVVAFEVLLFFSVIYILLQAAYEKLRSFCLSIRATKTAHTESREG